MLRHFNRTYTQRIGVLEDSYLGLGLPLGAARLVFEIGTTDDSTDDTASSPGGNPSGTTVRDLRERLGLDSGHLARLLRRLEERGLAALSPDPADRRRRIVQLTPRGQELWRQLDRRSEELAQRLVAALTDRQQARLTEALATADLLVRAATVELRTAHPSTPAARRALELYFEELDERFPTGFTPGDHHEELLAPGAGAFVLAISDGAPIACGGVQRIEPSMAEIKRMWVDRAWRGAGLGSRLLRHLESVAAELGFTTARLDTNGTLHEAIAMYERAGYRHIERYNDNPYAQAWFEKELPRTT